MSQRQKLESIAEKIKKCKKCSLHKTRAQAVPGQGSYLAKIMLIGEAPGREEDRCGQPFVGGAGKFLNELIKLANLKRENIFITNVLKCRPPKNRDPKPNEIKACRPYLEEQIKIIKPKLIITLGRYAMYNFLPESLKISRVHGKIKELKIENCPSVLSSGSKEKLKIFCTYHPAAALYQRNLKNVLRKDFRRLAKIFKTLVKK